MVHNISRTFTTSLNIKGLDGNRWRYSRRLEMANVERARKRARQEGEGEVGKGGVAKRAGKAKITRQGSRFDVQLRIRASWQWL